MTATLTGPYGVSGRQLICAVWTHLWAKTTSPSTIRADDLIGNLIVRAAHSERCRKTRIAHNISVGKFRFAMGDYKIVIELCTSYSI